MSDAPSKKKTGKKAKRKESSSPKSAKSVKSRASSSPGSPKEESHISDPPQNYCPRHNKEFKHFCDYHEEVLCDDCLTSPPYSNTQTRIIKIEEAYRKRFGLAYQILNSQLVPKREQIRAQLNLLLFKLDEIRNAKIWIEKDMKSEFSAMNERLNSAYGTKIALLEYDISELQSDLDRIDFIVNSIQGANSDIHHFLSKYQEIRDTGDLILSKPFRTEIDVDPDSLPKELAEIRENVAQYPALKELITSKDEIIWKLTHHSNPTGKVDEATQKELAEWAKLTENFSQELAKYRMNCEYCNLPLDNISVNSNCTRNSGNRHYFVKV